MDNKELCKFPVEAKNSTYAAGDSAKEIVNKEKYKNTIENKEAINFSDLAIYTTTLYKNDEVSKIRQQLAEKFIKNAAKLGIKWVLIDGASNKNFINFAKSFSNVKIKIEPQLGMGESRRFGLNVAMENAESQYFYGLSQKNIIL